MTIKYEMKYHFTSAIYLTWEKAKQKI